MIKDILNNEWTCKCIGCSIGSGEMTPPGGVILETENFVVTQDPEIPIIGFLIISSKKHIKSIAELTSEESQELFNLVYKSRMSMKNIKDLIEVTIIQEERSGHFHIWLLPRYKWMNEEFDNSLSSVRNIMNYARENFKTKDNIEEILNTVEDIRNILK